MDWLVFSSAWVAAVAGALALAAAAAMGASPAAPAVLRVAALAAAGTFAVYNVDRLRDVERDRATTPARAAFVSRHRRALTVAAALAGAAAVALGIATGLAAVALCAAVLVPGLLHRRWKGRPLLKAAYVTAAWLAVVVGLPALAVAATRAGGAGPVAAVLGASLLANVIASNVRDTENVGGARGARRSLRWAMGLCVVGVAGAWAGPPDVRPLVCVPVAVLASLSVFRRGERYGLWVVDGALLAGALASLALRV